MPNKIKINGVTGGSHKNDLKNCYFLPAAVNGAYDFYDTNNNSLASNLTSGTGFSFNLDSHNWTIGNFVISDSAASGDWSIPSITADESGTFQAQAGTGTDAEEASSAATS